MAHAGDPVYRFGPVGENFSPEIQTEDIGDDPVRASGYGIQNLKRILPNLPAWTATPGEGYADLAELYGELLSNWNRYTGHVRTVVGGVYATMKSTDQGGAVYEPVPGDRQREAVRFIIDQVFTDVAWLNDPAILSRIEGSGAVGRVQQVQASSLNGLLQTARMIRMSEAALLDPSAYTLPEFFADLKAGVWTELQSGASIDTYRRGLQRIHLERLGFLMEDPEEDAATLSRSDIRAMARGQLVEIREEAAVALSGTSDSMTEYHLRDVVARIDGILEG
jgi:hypothetical protein